MSKSLGHSNLASMSDVFAHLTTRMHERSAARMDSILAGHRRLPEADGVKTGVGGQTKAPPANAGGAISCVESGRGGAIRTLDLLNPIQVRYQAAPRPVDRR